MVQLAIGTKIDLFTERVCVCVYVLAGGGIDVRKKDTDELGD